MGSAFRAPRRRSFGTCERDRPPARLPTISSSFLSTHNWLAASNSIYRDGVRFSFVVSLGGSDVVRRELFYSADRFLRSPAGSGAWVGAPVRGSSVELLASGAAREKC